MWYIWAKCGQYSKNPGMQMRVSVYLYLFCALVGTFAKRKARLGLVAKVLSHSHETELKSK